VFGGAGKWEMQKALKEGPEIVVATPGRLIEMIKIKATNLARCTCVVLDEADRYATLHHFNYVLQILLLLLSCVLHSRHVATPARAS
jgi:superfamily II DNA/RNA helicase